MWSSHKSLLRGTLALVYFKEVAQNLDLSRETYFRLSPIVRYVYYATQSRSLRFLITQVIARYRKQLILDDVSMNGIKRLSPSYNACSLNSHSPVLGA